MCGIFAYCSENSSKKEIIKLIDLAKERGQDSYGITIIQENFSENFYSDNIEEIKKKVKNKILDGSKSLIIFNARLVTNGRNPENSQPVVTNEISLVHNGIICNFTNLNQHLSIELNFDPSDTVLLANKISTYIVNKSEIELNTFLNSLKGEMNLVIFNNKKKEILYYTNTGSLYFSKNGYTKILSSEILKLDKFDIDTCCKVNLNCLFKIDFNFRDFEKNNKKIFFKINKYSNNIEKITSNLFEKVEKKIESTVTTIKRCASCVLPETYPFIKFDENGICNFCKNFKSKKILGEAELFKMIENQYKSLDHKKCLVGLSGGFDSCYTLYAVKKLLKLDPIAYTYDWGLTTDYARINQSIICQKLGVEHIIRTEDLSKKRNYIKLNLLNWLKQPHPGMIPILMAGDKKFLYHEKKLRKQLNVPITFFGTGDQTENRPFYYFLAGAKYEEAKNNLVVMNKVSMQTKINLGIFYCWNYFKNPGYFNYSFFDNVKAYYYSFFNDHQYYGYFDYVGFDENKIKKFINDYELETDKKYGKVLWRMGDGQSSLNNLLYTSLCGFSELDDYESTKVRLGRVTREHALKTVKNHNMPKKENLEYFFSLIKTEPDIVFSKIEKFEIRKWL